MFEHVDAYAGDPILSLNEAFQKDPRAGKINLSIGIYFDNEGRIPMLHSVRAAELAVVEAAGARPYLPMEGAANFRSAVQALLFGADHSAIAAGRIATIQGVGSSGGLKVGAPTARSTCPNRPGTTTVPSSRARAIPARPIPTTTRPPAACASTSCWPASMPCRPAASC
jgi:aromatic-amino-acid transaminase